MTFHKSLLTSSFTGICKNALHLTNPSSSVESSLKRQPFPGTEEIIFLLYLFFIPLAPIWDNTVFSFLKKNKPIIPSPAILFKASMQQIVFNCYMLLTFSSSSAVSSNSSLWIMHPRRWSNTHCFGCIPLSNRLYMPHQNLKGKKFKDFWNNRRRRRRRRDCKYQDLSF